ncbi:hypothetical protein ACSBR1_025728 [Camellia fascicularis]
MITRNEKKTSSSSSSSSSSEENSHGEYAMQLASLSIFPIVLKSTIDLGLLQIIAKAGPGHNSIATILKHQSILIRCFGFSLAIRLSIGAQQEKKEEEKWSNRVYDLALVSKYFIPNQDGVSFAPLF